MTSVYNSIFNNKKCKCQKWNVLLRYKRAFGFANPAGINWMYCCMIVDWWESQKGKKNKTENNYSDNKKIVESALKNIMHKFSHHCILHNKVTHIIQIPDADALKRKHMRHNEIQWDYFSTCNSFLQNWHISGMLFAWLQKLKHYRSAGNHHMVSSLWLLFIDICRRWPKDDCLIKFVNKTKSENNCESNSWTIIPYWEEVVT